MNQEIYNKWKSIGFLEGLPEKDGAALAEKFEELANFMLQNEYNDHVEIMAFPTLRRAFVGGLNEKYSPRELCEKLKSEYTLFETKGCKEYFRKIDLEGEVCVAVTQYFTRDKNKKITLFYKK